MTKGGWDYIIVGGGSAGCVLASRLSADPSVNVLVLEAGGSNASPYVRIPAGIGSAIFRNTLNWKYPAVADPTRGGMVDSWSGGRGLGGSSSINGMLFMRGARADYDGWSDLGCTGWDYASVLPHFRAIESFEGGADDYRGGEGPLSVTFPATQPELVDTWIQTARNCGHDHNPDYNGARQEGVGLAQGSIYRGRRHSAAEAFLKPVLGRPNLRVRTGSHVTRVVFEDSRATGVECERDGTREVLSARGEIILSSGAIRTPGLLMHSGIGPANVLSKLGITVLADRGAVGGNLMEHPGIYVRAFTSLPTFNRAGRPWNMPFVMLDWLLRGKGAAAVGTTTAQLLAKSSEGEPAPDLQVLLSLVHFGVNASGSGVELARRDGFSMACCLMTPKSRGRVTITSPDPREKPRVEHTMFAHDEDIDRLAQAAREALKLLHTRPLKDHIEEIDFPIAADAGRDEWHDCIRRAAFRGDHPSGTCRMGTDNEAVVDPRLRVCGVEGLRIADTSIIPVIPRANTNATAMMIGDKAAAMILEDRRS